MAVRISCTAVMFLLLFLELRNITHELRDITHELHKIAEHTSKEYKA